MKINHKLFLSFLILAGALTFSVMFVTSAKAQSLKGITFPIAELDNCGSIRECKNYCDIDTLRKKVTQNIDRGFPTQPIIDRFLENRAFRLGNSGFSGLIALHGKNVSKGKTLYKTGINFTGATRNSPGPVYTFVEFFNKDGRRISASKPRGGAPFRGFFGPGFQKPESFPITAKITLQDGKKITLQLHLNRSSSNSAGPAGGGGVTEEDVLNRKKACDGFAAKHGLGNGQARNKKLAAIEEDGGPGECALNTNDPYTNCQGFCGTPDNMRACIDWAKKQKAQGITVMSDKELKEAEKIIPLLESGEITLPAECTDMHSCKEVCERPPTPEVAEQCFEIARKAGFLPPEVDPQKAREMFQAAQRGEIDFGQMEKCEDPPDDATFQECIRIGEKYGLIPPEDLEMIKKTGGKGPGDCKGRKKCEEFCNNPENQETCFKFAEEHGLIPPEELEKAKGGIGEIQKVLAQAPPEVKQCLITAIGQDLITQIESGIVKNLFALKDLRGPMEDCFIKHGGGPDRERRELPPGARECLERKGIKLSDLAGKSQAEMPPEVIECFGGGPGGPGGSPAFMECLKNAGITDPRNIDPSNPPPAVIRCSQEHGGPGGPSGQGGFPGDPGGDHDGSPSSSRTERAGVIIKRSPIGINVEMNIPGGIKEFRIGPSYGGGLNQCPEQDRRDVSMPAPSKDSPLTITVTSCEDKKHTFTFTEFKVATESGGSGQGGPGRPGFPGGPGTGGPGGFPPEVAECIQKLGLRLTGPPSGEDEARIRNCVEEKFRNEQPRDEKDEPERREEKHDNDRNPQPPDPRPPQDKIPPEVLKQLEELRGRFPGGNIPDQILQQFESRGVPKEIIDRYRGSGNSPSEPPPSKAESVCHDRGGKWDGKECKLPSGPPGPPGPNPEEINCRNKGGQWIADQKRCQLDPARECELSGGTWIAPKNLCERNSPPPGGPPPPDPKIECEKRGGKWIGSKCEFGAPPPGPPGPPGPPPPDDPAKKCASVGGTWIASERRCKLAQFNPPTMLNFFARLLGITN